MLLKKLENNQGCKSKKVIGLLGVHHGAGVTYTGMLLAYYFAFERRLNTAYMECNHHKDFQRLQELYEWSKEDEYSFSLDKITYYKEVSRNKISDIFNEDYQCLILDFGTDFASSKDEFMRCGTKIIIGGRAIWNQSKMVTFLQSLDNIRGSRKWIHMIPLADQRIVMGMAMETDRYFYAVPFESDPTRLSKETYRLFDNLFG